METLTPKITAEHVVSAINKQLQIYVGEICLFWDESTHYYGCIGGYDDGYVGKIRDIKAYVEGDDDDVCVNVQIHTSDNKLFNCSIDNLRISTESDCKHIDGSAPFSADENGVFNTIEIEPLFDLYDLSDPQEWMSYADIIASVVLDLIKDNFDDTECIIRDCDEDETYGPMIVKDIVVEPFQETECIPTIEINDGGPIPYLKFEISKI